MNKPSWQDAPTWARYLAMDRNGMWLWFECKPTASPSHGEWRQNSGRCEPCVRWTATLETRPEVQP